MRNETVATVVDEGVHQRSAQTGALFDRYHQSSRGLAFVLLGDTRAAEEVVPGAFVKVLFRRPQVLDLEWQPAYIRKIVVNLCRSRMCRGRLEERVGAWLRPCRACLGTRPNVTLSVRRAT